MNRKFINYQGNIFVQEVIDSAILSPVCFRGQRLANGNSKILLCFLRLPHNPLSFLSVLFFLMVINFIFNYLHLKYIEIY